jgi:glycosyltransferase involved in cell wall biosynthesis
MIRASGAGLVVPPDDPDAFVDGLRALLSDRASLAAMGAAGRAFVQQSASPRAVALAYVRLIRDLGG